MYICCRSVAIFFSVEVGCRLNFFPREMRHNTITVNKMVKVEGLVHFPPNLLRHYSVVSIVKFMQYGSNEVNEAIFITHLNLTAFTYVNYCKNTVFIR